MGEISAVDCSGWSTVRDPVERCFSAPELLVCFGDEITTLMRHRADGASTEVQLADPCTATVCKPWAISRFSPDGKLVAGVHEDDNVVRVFDTTSGAVTAAVALAPSEVPLTKAFGFSAAGFALVTIPRPPPAMEYGTLLFSPMGGSVQRTKELKLEDYTAPYGILVDPLGRWLFLAITRQQGFDIDIYDAPTGRMLPLSYVGLAVLPQGAFTHGEWIPGKYPVWETIVEGGTNKKGEMQFTALRLYTAPGVYGISLVGPFDRPSRRRVKDDGKTIVAASPGDVDLAEVTGPLDPSGRFEAIDSSSLRRVADGAVLRLQGADGCASTSDGVFDCLEAATHVFRLGDDPRNAPVMTGAQLAPLLWHPHLAADYFGGLAVKPKPEMSTRVGMPPSLRVASVVRAPALVVSVSVEDGGDGASTIRSWVAGKLTDAVTPVVGSAEMPVKVPLLKPCSAVALQACNATGTACSEPISIETCPKKPPIKQKP